MALWLTFVYAPVAHMVWGGGWLATLGMKDFAGGCVVHVNAGIAALVGCLLMGKRVGYGKEAMPPHSLAFTMVGASLLWVGWFGFNVGSALAVDGTRLVSSTRSLLPQPQSSPGCLPSGWSRASPSMAGCGYRRGRRPGRDHPGVRVRRPDGLRSCSAGILRRHLPVGCGHPRAKEHVPVTTTRWTSSGCTRSAAHSGVIGTGVLMSSAFWAVPSAMPEGVSMGSRWFARSRER